MVTDLATTISSASSPTAAASSSSPQDSLSVDQLWPHRRAAYLAVIIIILGVYSFPAIRTAITTKSTRLPAVTAPDQGMYLTVSKLHAAAGGTFVNPYYHVALPYPLSYLKFRFGPYCFGLLNEAMAGRIWLAFFVWNLLWWSLLCVSAIWLFEKHLPRATIELVLAGTALITLFGLDGLQIAVRGWAQTSQIDLLNGLPYIRAFTPQVAMPLLLFYFGLQIRALKQPSLAPWGVMAVLQFIAFTSFPYATLVMAGTTAVASVWYLSSFAGLRLRAWGVVLGFLLVCAALDLAFALNRSGGFRSGFPAETSPIQFQPSVIVENIGKLWILTAVLTAATAISRKLRPELKWPLLGLGISILLFKFSDAVVAERLFFISDHIGYFYNATIVILFMFLASAYFPVAAGSLRRARTACLAVLAVCIVYGLLMAQGNYKANLPYNLEQADFSAFLASGKVASNDLILTQFENSRYDDCEWIPLLSDAESLFCRNAQVLLTPEQKRDIQRLREVLYLYFDGKDHQWLETTTQFTRTGIYGELSSYRSPEELSARIAALRQEMRPMFDRIERKDPSITSFFHRFRRVWVIQNRENHLFADDRLASYLELQQPQVSGTLLIIAARPK